MLGADVVVAEAQRLAQRELEHLLGSRRERDLPGGDLLARPDDPDDLSAHALDRDVQRLEDARSQTLLLAEQAEQDVLGADVVVLERPRFFLSQDDYLAGSLCESLEHDPSLLRGGSRSVRSGWFSGLLLAYLLRYMVVRDSRGHRRSRSTHRNRLLAADLMSETVSIFRAIGQFTNGSTPSLRHCLPRRGVLHRLFMFRRPASGSHSYSICLAVRRASSPPANRSTRCSAIAIPELRPPAVTTSPESTQRTHARPVTSDPSRQRPRRPPSASSTAALEAGRATPGRTRPVHTDATTPASRAADATAPISRSSASTSSIATAPGTIAHRATASQRRMRQPQPSADRPSVSPA